MKEITIIHIGFIYDNVFIDGDSINRYRFMNSAYIVVDDQDYPSWISRVRDKQIDEVLA